MDVKFYEDAIKRLEQNIEFIKHSNMCRKERNDLKQCYQQQIANHKHNLMSFLKFDQN